MVNNNKLIRICSSFLDFVLCVLYLPDLYHRFPHPEWSSVRLKGGGGEGSGLASRLGDCGFEILEVIYFSHSTKFLSHFTFIIIV